MRSLWHGGSPVRTTDRRSGVSEAIHGFRPSGALRATLFIPDELVTFPSMGLALRAACGRPDLVPPNRSSPPVAAKIPLPISCLRPPGPDTDRADGSCRAPHRWRQAQHLVCDPHHGALGKTWGDAGRSNHVGRRRREAACRERGAVRFRWRSLPRPANRGGRPLRLCGRARRLLQRRALAPPPWTAPPNPPKLPLNPPPPVRLTKVCQAYKPSSGSGCWG